jgi:hypothetical protein
MNNWWSALPWVNRLFLIAPLAIFTLLTIRIISDPVGSAFAHGMSLDSPVGLTNYRAGNGGIFLGFVLITVWCLISTHKHVAGLSFIATIMGAVLGLRAVSAIADATLSDQIRLLIAEAVFLTLSVAGILLEMARRRHLNSSYEMTGSATELRGPELLRDGRRAMAEARANSGEA